jgi:hypothetical protein
VVDAVDGRMPRATIDVLVNWAVDSIKVPVIMACLIRSTQPVWQLIVATSTTLGMSDRALFVAVTMAVHTALYVGLNSLFLAFDRYQLLEAYKLERKPHEVPSSELIRRTIMTQLFSQLVIRE